MEAGRGLEVGTLTWPVIHIDLPPGFHQRDPQRFRPVPPEGHQAVSVDPDVEGLVGSGIPHVVADHLVDLTVAACGDEEARGQFSLYV